MGGKREHFIQGGSNKVYNYMNSTTYTVDTRILQIIIAIATFTMLAVAIFHFSKNTSVTVPVTMEWASDTSSWKGGWK